MLDFEFHAELFDYRAQAISLLAQHDICWMTDYSSVDLQHREFGLEISGVRTQQEALNVSQILKLAFPVFVHHHIYHKDGREPGYVISLSRDPKNREAQPYQVAPEDSDSLDDALELVDALELSETVGYKYAQAIVSLLTQGSTEELLGLLEWKNNPIVDTEMVRNVCAGVAILKAKDGQASLNFDIALLDNLHPHYNTILVYGITFVSVKNPACQISLRAKDPEDSNSVGKIWIPTGTTSLYSTFAKFLDQWVLLNLVKEAFRGSFNATLHKLGKPNQCQIDSKTTLEKLLGLLHTATQIKSLKIKLSQALMEAGLKC